MLLISDLLWGFSWAVEEALIKFDELTGVRR